MYYYDSYSSLIRDYIEGLKQIYASSQDDFDRQHEALRAAFLDGMDTFRDTYPGCCCYHYPKAMSADKARSIISRCATAAAGRCTLPLLEVPHYYIDTIQYQNIVVRGFEQFGSYMEISFDHGSDVAKDLNQMLLHLLLMMPVKKLKLTFVDLSGSYIAAPFYSGVSPVLYNQKPITDLLQFREYLTKQNDRVLRCVQKYGDIVQYNEANNLIAEPYEVVVLLDKLSAVDPYAAVGSELSQLAKNGSAGGVYILDCVASGAEAVDISALCCSAILAPSYYEDIPALKAALLQYLNSEAEKEETRQAIKADYAAQAKAGYEALESRLEVGVGKDGISEVSFCLDQVSHVHAFILGQSGSGKSVFLHNVISGAMLKYAPEDLELYLLDFKLGGVEFNRYKGAKHVHALLVDNSDQQITLEILREIRDRMTERGKLLRAAGATNILEYNQANPGRKLPHILFVADECHEMFRVDSSVPRIISSEISDVVVKIAKEGRSQGVHLLLSTQTLANTEISSEILNNVSDHYLFKCALADSERMVSNSSAITQGLSTGEVYYHHVDTQRTFQAFFADKAASAEVIAMIRKKASGHAGCSAFYFSGSSLYRFSGQEMPAHQAVCSKKPVAFLGKSIDLKQSDVKIPFADEFSENILLVGLNDEEQATRLSISALVSLAFSARYRGQQPNIKVVSCLNTDESRYSDVLEALDQKGLIEVVAPKQRVSFFRRLADQVQSSSASEMILFILGQDRFRELKMDMPLDDAPTAVDSGFTGFFGAPAAGPASTFRQALSLILDKGPEQGVHTFMQLEKASNFLFTDYLSPKDLFRKFKHLVLLKSDEKTSMELHLRDDIHLEKLSKEPERMRAYYYSEEKDEYMLFTPFMAPTVAELNQLFHRK